ncbi:MAG: enoyl-CoA hydratase-related protein [Acidimicrobiia bacterium]
MTHPVRAALDEHLDAVATGDLVRVAAGYAPDARLVSHEGTVAGRDEVTRWFAERADFFTTMELHHERVDVLDGMAGLDWWGRVGGRALEGRDEFDVDADGLITEQRVVRVGRSQRDDHVPVRIEVEPPVGRIVLARDAKRNAVSQPMLAVMKAALADLAADERVGAVLLVGEGRDFCAGEDVRGFEFPDAATAERFLHGPLDLFTAMEELPKPIVVAVHGNALGFGSEVLLAADTVVAAPDARFGFAEIDHGAVPSVLVTRGLDTVFRRRVLRFALTGERFGTDVAVGARMVHLVADDPRAVAEEVAREHAGWAPASVRTVKALLGCHAADDHDRAREFMPRVLVDVEPSI